MTHTEILCPESVLNAISSDHEQYHGVMFSLVMCLHLLLWLLRICVFEDSICSSN